MEEKNQIVHSLVEWCLDRSEIVSDADELALLHEFDEWILYENGEVLHYDFLSFTVKN